jgi:predicted nucleic acid-binding protein
MIILDTNYMVAMSDREKDANDAVMRWIKEGRGMATSAAAWMEFCTGPIDPVDWESMEWLLEDRILPFGRVEAELAARIYRVARCRCDDRMDTMIAATAIVAKASLATRNVRDFARFVPFGLKLA